MKPLNLYFYTRIDSDDESVFISTEKNLSRKKGIIKFRKHEFETEKAFCNKLYDERSDLSVFDNFYHSFELPQIGKEMDLLRISDSIIINIELKSNIEEVSETERINQLKKNKYFLSFLEKQMFLLSYTQGEECLKKLDGEALCDFSFSELYHLLKAQNEDSLYDDDLEDLFDVTNYLISPFNSSDRFLDKEYFLTPRQQEIKNNFINTAKIIHTLTGAPGTGKTLLLYDIAVEMSKKGNTCIIHSGILNDGHKHIEEAIPNLTILSAKKARLSSGELYLYKYIFIDEAHRIYLNTLKDIINCCMITKANRKLLISYDYNQCMSKSEQNRNIPKFLEEFTDIKQYKLKEKIRTNEELSSFIKLVMKTTDNSGKIKSFPSAKILYANNELEAQNMIKYIKEEKNYTFINYTGSIYDATYYSNFEGLENINAHQAIGQEFDNVVVVIGKNFSYNTDNRIIGSKHPTGDYSYRSMLFQALTRVRKKICIIVVNNKPVYERLISLEKYE